MRSSHLPGRCNYSGKKGPEVVRTNTPIVCLRQISAVFSDMQVLNHVDLAIYPGECHGIIGKNGAGKTVLANILSGSRQPDQGEVLLDGTPIRFKNQADAFRRGIVFSPQHLALLENGTVFDNLSGSDTIRACFGAQKRQCEQRITEALAAVHLDCTPHTPVRLLSYAEKYLLQFSRSLLFLPRLLILDELSAALSDVELQTVFRLLRRCRDEGTAILYFTHSAQQLPAWVDAVHTLRDGQLSDGARLPGTAVQNPYPRLRHTHGKPVLQTEHLTNAYLQDISLQFLQGEIVGIAGKAGAGKSQLLQALVDPQLIRQRAVRFPQLPGHASAGQMLRQVAYLSDEWEKNMLFTCLSIGQNITIRNLERISRCGVLQLQEEDFYAKQLLETLGWPEIGFQKDLSELSSGTRQKIALAQCLFAKCGIYLFDEPTQNIDIAGKVDFYNIVAALAKSGSTVLIASSDLQELTGICDRLIVLQHGRVQYHAAADQYAHTDLVRLLRTPPTESGSYSNFQ